MRGDFHPDSGRVCASVLLNRAHPPTAMFFSNDLMAMGAMRAVAQNGCRVPEDVSIVGYDNIEFASYTTPPLTTIEQPTVEVGYRAAHLLIDRIADPARPWQKIVLPTRLIFRESSGPVPQSVPEKTQVEA